MHIQVSLMVEIDASASLASMEEQIQGAGQQAMRLALQQAVHQWEQHHRQCPSCGSEQVRLEGTVPRQVHALFGAVRLARQRWRCQHCFRRFCPATPLLEPMQRGRVSPALLEAACLAGSSWPYRQAAAVLRRLCGAQISAEELRLLTNQRGREVAHTQEQAAARQSSFSLPVAPVQARTGESERTIVSMDGGWVPNRERRGGMEGKVAVIARDKQVLREPAQPSSEMTWVQLEKYLQHHRHPAVRRWRFATHRYAATFATSAVLGQQAAAAVEQVRSATSELVVISDGAHWIKKETQKYFPEATCILDWPHLWRTIAKAVRAVGLAREADHRWTNQQLQRLGDLLWKGEVEAAQVILESWQQEQQGHPPIKALTAALTYLNRQRDWIGSYEQWRRQGYPVGSGIIERTVALVMNRRMKRQGMSWLRRNATSVVALRVAWLNDEWPFPAATCTRP